MLSTNENKVGAVLAGLLAIVLWGAIPALVKVGSLNLPISFLILIRFSISTVLVLPVVFKTFDRFNSVPRRVWLGLVIVLGANYFFQALAMSELPVSWYVVIFSLNPVLALLSLKMKLSRSAWVACLVAAISTFVFIRADEFADKVSMIGVISLIVGMLTWVGYTYLAKGLQKVYNDSEVTAVTQLVSFIAVLMIWIGHVCPVANLDKESLISVVILGITSPIAYWSFSYSLRRLPVFCIVSQYLEPVIGLILGTVYFNEPLGMQQLIGSALLIVSMGWLANSSSD